MSTVVVVKLKRAGQRGALKEPQYRRMLGVALGELGGIKRVVPPGTVGFKCNCLTRKLNSTSPHLASALAGLIEDAGREPNDIIVWERSSDELADSQFTLNASNTGRRCLGTDARGVGYSSEFYSSKEVNSLVSRVLTELIEVSINLPILKDHSIAGMSAGLKNMYGAIHNPNKYHGHNCDPYCAHVNNLQPIREKHALTILDAIRVQYQGGPGYLGAYIAWCDALVVGVDPVAVDRVGLRILEHIREQHGQPPLPVVGRPVRYLQTAQKIGLGTADDKQIDLRVLDMSEDGDANEGNLFE